MSRVTVLSLSILVFFCTLSPAGDQILQPSDHYRETRIGDPVVSPDGKWIAYSVATYCERTDKKEADIYLLPFGGGKPLHLTTMAGDESDYSWHPDSRSLLFIGEEEKFSQVFTISISGGESVKLTHIKADCSAPAWSPDGKKIAFNASVGEHYSEEEKEFFGDVRYYRNLRYYHLGPGWDDGKRKRIFVLDAAGGEAKQLTDGPCADEGDHSFAWSPDGKKIAFVSNRDKEWWNTIDTNIYTVDVESGEIEQVSTNIGPDHNPAWSPDGSMLAWRSIFEWNYESEPYKLRVKDLAGGVVTTLTATLDRDVRAFKWASEGSSLLFTVAREGNQDLYTVNAKKPEDYFRLTDGRFISAFDPAPNDKVVVLMGESDKPAEICVKTNGSFSRLTSHAEPFWEQFTPMPAEEIWATSPDGTKVQGWLIKPVGYEEGTKYPLVLSIHGGPHGMYAPTLRFEFQLFAQNGYAVLFTNPRGSDGYGQAFADVIIENWGDKPFEDIMACVDHVIAMGCVDPARMGVMGTSYGGFMTNWILGHTDRFATAISVAGLSNMVSFWGATDEQFFAEKEMRGLPWINKDVYVVNSPLMYADKFVTPTMVMHGGNDWRVRPEQGRQLFTALQKMGVPSVWVEFPDEQHGVKKRYHRDIYYRLKLDWYGHWLKGQDPGLATYITPEKYVHPDEPRKNVK